MSELEITGGDVQQVQATLQLFEQGREQIGRVIAGQQELIEQALLTLLCGGHALVEGVPGVAKTLAQTRDLPDLGDIQCLDLQLVAEAIT